VLAARGFSVHAVDPAELAPSVTKAARVVHEKTTAGRFLAETKIRADIVVNDMRMDPMTSCETMLQAARILKPGGLAVVTLKLPENHPAPVAQAALAVLKRGYTILDARQLYYNRREATVALQVLK
jgi:23S rRNA (cytidine2498-2'-O)-methyltransferase